MSRGREHDPKIESAQFRGRARAKGERVHSISESRDDLPRSRKRVLPLGSGEIILKSEGGRAEGLAVAKMEHGARCVRDEAWRTLCDSGASALPVSYGLSPASRP